MTLESSLDLIEKRVEFARNQHLVFTSLHKMNYLSCFFIFTCNTLRIRSFINYDGWLGSRNSSTEILHFQQNEFCPVNRELFTSRKDRTLSFDTDLWQLIWMTEFSYISASDFHLNADLLEFSRLVAHFAFFHFSTWIRSSMTYPCAGARAWFPCARTLK